MPRTDAIDVIELIDLLVATGARPIVAGGWGIDALIGEQGRSHADLDVAIDSSSETAVVDALINAGFVITADWRPVRVALTHPDGAEIDLHPVDVMPDGTRIQQGFDGATFKYRTVDITEGSIDGRTVACISARLQMRFHDGYEPSDTDVFDCVRLSHATGLPVPASIAPLIESPGTA